MVKMGEGQRGRAKKKKREILIKGAIIWLTRNLALGKFPGGTGELSVFCQSYFNKMLIGQAGSIGRKARQEVEVEQRDWEYSRKLPLSVLPRPPERKDVSCHAEKGTEPCG